MNIYKKDKVCKLNMQYYYSNFVESVDRKLFFNTENNLCIQINKILYRKYRCMK